MGTIENLDSLQTKIILDKKDSDWRGEVETVPDHEPVWNNCQNNRGSGCQWWISRQVY